MTTPITSPGSYGAGDYYLANDVTVSGGTALAFTGASRFNLNGKRLRSTAGGIGVICNATNSFVVTGGGASWVDGFDYGVMSSAQWTRVEGVVFENIKYIAANLTGHNSRFIANMVLGVGGKAGESYAVGVNIGGNNVVVLNNVFRNIYRQIGSPPDAHGVGVPVLVNAMATNATVEMNYMANDDTREKSLGVFGGIGGGHGIRKNQIINFHTGIEGGSGTPGLTVTDNVLWAREPLAGSIGVSAIHGTAEQNILIGFDAAFSRGIPQANNIIV